jgi:predicted Zn-dependent protease
LSFSMARILAVSTLAFLCAGMAVAQQSFTIVGELTADDATGLDRYTVEVLTEGNHFPIVRAFVATSGRFELRGLAPGPYHLEVKNPAGDTVVQESLTPSPLTSMIRLTVPSNSEKPKPISGTISAASLNHKTPRKALKEMEVAQTFKDAGDHPKAIEHLRAAVEIDPRSVEAHTNLGVEYGRAGKYPEARAEFTTTIELGLRGAQQYCNLAVVSLEMSETEVAESNIRRALAIDSRYPQANYLMGKLLAVRPDRYDDAARYLKLAAPGMPAANLILAQVYARSGRKQSAIDALTVYEQTAPPTTRPKLEAMIKSLR